MYIVLQEPSEAEAIFLQALEINPGHIASRDSLAHLYLSQKKWKEAEYHFLELTRHNPNYPSAWYQLACLAAMDGRKDSALEYLENAIGKGQIDYDTIIKESRLAKMQETEVFKALMQKYYPEEQKN
jgi:tetratricopeptide (TPR) repeat protein